MSLPRYPKYKDSGVEWLGDVPAQWSLTTLKRVVNPERGITYGIVQAGPHCPDGIPYIRPADMTAEQGVFSPDEVMRTSQDIADAYSRSTIRTGDLVCSIGPSFGKVMITPPWLDGANLTQGTARIAVQPPSDPRYVFWVLRSPLSFAQWESSVGGATFRALNLGPLAETLIPVPSASEQARIAAFLDRETAKIDALVAEQERLIGLLKEKRQAIISHAVTKGLNPDAPMKSSGVEWLGDVPSHWQVSRMSYLLSEPPKNGLSPEISAEGTVQTFSTAALRDGAVAIDEAHLKWVAISQTEAERYLVAEGDVFVLRGSGSKDYVGRAGIARRLPAGGCIYPDILIRIRPNRLMLPDFIVALLNSGLVRPQLEAAALTAAGIWKISGTALRGLRLPVPPLDEQHQIASWVHDEADRIAALGAEAQRAIELLQERRAALISAAVTGQIDVSGLAGVTAGMVEVTS